VAVAAALGLAGLAGCTPAEHDLPSLNEGTGAGLSDLEQVGKAFYDCLTDAGLPVELRANSTGQVALVQFGASHTVVGRDADRSPILQLGTASEQAFNQQVEDFLNSASTDPELLVDGIDQSAPWATCLDTTGYSVSAAQSTFQMDPAVFEAQVKANNQWAACVRDNGFPNVKDTVMPQVLDGTQWPTVLLPVTMTEEQLRELVAACPTFYAARQEELDNFLQESPNATGPPADYVPYPSISFDSPGMSADYIPDESLSPEDLATRQRLIPMFDILYEVPQTDADSLQDPTEAPS
jgi:hypothetical protein